MYRGNPKSSRGSLAWNGRQTHNPIKGVDGAQRIRNLEVAGSNPAPGTTKHYFKSHIIEVVFVVDISS
jgi:hypothetical protein